MNTQKPEIKTNIPNLLEIHSIFKTIQGEGPFSGWPAIFIRLAGCNLQCPHCDTEYSIKRKVLDIKSILYNVLEVGKPHPINLVVITGGEPFRQNISLLCHELLNSGYIVQVETNGTLPINVDPDEIETKLDLTKLNRHGKNLVHNNIYIVCSPKTNKIHPKNKDKICAFKYVLKAGAICEKDGLPTSVLGYDINPYRPAQHIPIYIQPEDEQNPETNLLNLNAVIHSSINYGYIAQIQMHKYLNLE